MKLLAATGLVASTVVGAFSLFGLALAYSENHVGGAYEAMLVSGLVSLTAVVVWLGCLVFLVRQSTPAKEDAAVTDN